MKSFYCKIAVDDIAFGIRQALRDYFSYKISDDDILNISFDGQNVNGDLEFKKLLEDICENNSDEPNFMLFKEYLNGRNNKFKLSISFDKTIFEGYPNFDNLRCHKLVFENTYFKQGAKLRFIDVDELVYEPRELGADVTFSSQGYADINNKKLFTEKKGRIGKFKYRHNLEGGGYTFFIGAEFEEYADFSNAVLNKVQFSHINLSKCFFASSILEGARFNNCEFDITPNRFHPFGSNGFAFGALITVLCVAFMALMAIYETVFLVILILIVPVLFPILVFLINSVLFMPIMFCIRKIEFFDTINSHYSTADERSTLPFTRKDYGILRDIYKQLRTNFEQHNDYQVAGELYYSQRYCEIMGFKYGKFIGQQMLFHAHHFINGFGERWLRAFVWFLLTIVCAGIFINPNKDYVASANTPDFLVTCYDKRQILKLEQNNSEYYITTAEINNSSGNSARPIISEKVMFLQDNNTTKKQVVKLEETTARLVFAVDRMSAPLKFGSQNSWFEVRTKAGHYGGMLSTVLLWIFFLAFISAVKNRIRR